MIIVGCDFHTRFQQIAMPDPTTGEVLERRFEQENGEAEKFCATLPGPARVDMEATINAPWFERILNRYHHELWIGDAAKIRAARVRKQKTDSRDAVHLWICCSQIAFCASGFRPRPTGTPGECCGIDTSWFASGLR